MKSVGRLGEFINPHRSGQLPQSRACYVYRRVLVQENLHRAEFTGLLLGALPANDLTRSCLVYKADAGIEEMIKQCVETEPDYSLRSQVNTTLHQFWFIKDAGMQTLLENKLYQISGFYPLDSWDSPAAGSVAGTVSDGDAHADAEDLTFSMLLADNELKPQPCHRLLADLAGMDDYEFLQRLQKCFNIRVASGAVDARSLSEREFGLYVAGNWYHLRLIDGTWFHADPVSDLDVSIVHDNMIAPMLGITNRRDPRVAYTNVDCNVQSLQQQVDSGQWQAAWLMPAPTVEQLMNISDLGRCMPANSVCFAPVIDAAVLAGIAR